MNGSLNINYMIFGSNYTEGNSIVFVYKHNYMLYGVFVLELRDQGR